MMMDSLNKEQLEQVIAILEEELASIQSIDSLDLTWNPIRNWTEIIATKKAHTKLSSIIDIFSGLNSTTPVSDDPRDNFN